jgi:hypothetical protein
MGGYRGGVAGQGDARAMVRLLGGFLPLRPIGPSADRLAA